MPEEFDQTVLDAYDSLAGEDAGTPVVPQEPATTDSGAPADTGAQPTGEGTAEGSEQPFRWDNLPEPVVPLAKQLQADYTRKMQEIAETRRQFEQQQQEIAETRRQFEQQQQQYAGFAYLQQLAQTDPAQAAALLQQYAAQLAGAGQAGQQPETDPYAGVEPVTDGERLLLEKVRQLEQQSQEWQQFQEEQKARAGWEKLNAEYTALEKEIGRQINETEREQIAAHCLRRGIGTVTAGYRDLHWETEINRAKQLGRDEASTVVQAKAAGAPAPSALVSRTPTNAPPPANDRELISQLYDQMVSEAV